MPAAVRLRLESTEGARNKPTGPTETVDGTLAPHRLAAESGRDVSDLPGSPCGWRHAATLRRQEIAESCGIASGGGRHGAGPDLNVNRVATDAAVRISDPGIDDDLRRTTISDGWKGESELDAGQLPPWIWLQGGDG